MTHASNVCGTMMPYEQVGAFCRERGLLFIADTAQTAGVWPLDMEHMKIDALAFTGHKGLLGPQGIGGFLLGEKLPASDGEFDWREEQEASAILRLCRILCRIGLRREL